MSPQQEPDARTQALLSKVTAWVCHLCLDGAGGECHTPGCLFWCHDGPAPADRGATLRKLLVGVGSIDGVMTFPGGEESTDPPSLGHVVREQRQAAGLTLRELAARCGMTAVKLGEIERGVSVPDAGDLAWVFRRIDEAAPGSPRCACGGPLVDVDRRPGPRETTPQKVLAMMPAKVWAKCLGCGEKRTVLASKRWELDAPGVPRG